MSEHKGDTDWQSVAAALNSQLAAEKEVGHNTAVALAQQIIGLEDQLAAERKKSAKLEFAASEFSEQLDAERKARDEFRRALEQRIGEVDELRQQLAAAVEALREARCAVEFLSDSDALRLIDAALAKVEEAK